MQGIARPLLAWYARHGRDLPWRRTRDPYAIWVSEIMLQQTQADRVRKYFPRFLRRFPTVQAVAEAGEEELLKAWEGLGYYRRARQLQAAARRIVDAYDGRLPDTAHRLRSLPGVGRYTAGAIASIAFDRREPIVEANSRRVLARVAAHTGRLESASDDEPLWEIAFRLLPRRGAGRFNQALMDLGSMVCTPIEPACDACPLTRVCESFRRGLTGEIPRRPRGRAIQRRRERVIVYRRRGRVLLEQRGEREWWTGLWDFPRESLGGRPGPGAARRKIAAATPERMLGTFSYAVTHHRIEVVVVERIIAGRTRTSGGKPQAVHPGARWVPLGELATVAMTAPGRRVARMVCSTVAVRSQAGRTGRRS